MRVPVVLKIALRNVREHSAKTAIVGTLIAVGVAALVIGNSTMDTAAEGIRNDYIRTFTGDLVVAGAADQALSLFGFAGNSPQGQVTPPTVDAYRALRDYLEGHELVAAVSPQVQGAALVSVDQEQAGFTFAFGVLPEAYEETFPNNIEIVEGRFLEPGETGIVLNATSRERLEESSGKEIGVGDRMLLTGSSRTAGIRIRSVDVVGVFAFYASNPQLDNVSLVDAQTVRALNAMNVSPVEAVELSEAESRLLGEVSEDELFGGDAEGSLFGDVVIRDDEGDAAAAPADDAAAGRAAREEELLDIFASVPERPSETDDATAWHFLVVRASGPGAVPTLAADLRTFIDEQKIEAQVLDWQQAAGTSASFVKGIQIALNATIVLVAVVAVIIIMNTLVVSVTERIPEIGTMRAIGAQKAFVRRMILAETGILTLVFGVLGALLGMAILAVLGAVGIEATNPFLRFIFGGEVLRPVVSARAVGGALVGVIVAGLVASIYPTRVALQIRPVVAMQGK